MTSDEVRRRIIVGIGAISPRSLKPNRLSEGSSRHERYGSGGKIFFVPAKKTLFSQVTTDSHIDSIREISEKESTVMEVFT